MTVEDGVLLLADRVHAGLFVSHRVDRWAAAFVTNVASYVRADKPLSTEQSRIILRLIARVRDDLVEQAGAEPATIDWLIAHPSYRQPPHQSANVPREVRYLGEGFLGFRFKRNDAVSADLKAMVRDQDFPFEDIWFHLNHRIWVVPVNRDTLIEIVDVIDRHRFACDAEVSAYLARAADALGDRSSASTDREIGVIAVQVRDNEMVSWLLRDVLRGEPV